MRHACFVADGSAGVEPITLRTFADVLRHAADRGVREIRTACSIRAGYDEDGEREQWIAQIFSGKGSNVVTVGRGRTHEDAVISALQTLGVTW